MEHLGTLKNLRDFSQPRYHQLRLMPQVGPHESSMKTSQNGVFSPGPGCLPTLFSHLLWVSTKIATMNSCLLKQETYPHPMYICLNLFEDDFPFPPGGIWDSFLGNVITMNSFGWNRRDRHLVFRSSEKTWPPILERRKRWFRRFLCCGEGGACSRIQLLLKHIQSFCCDCQMLVYSLDLGPNQYEMLILFIVTHKQTNQTNRSNNDDRSCR